MCMFAFETPGTENPVSDVCTHRHYQALNAARAASSPAEQPHQCLSEHVRSRKPSHLRCAGHPGNPINALLYSQHGSKHKQHVRGLVLSFALVYTLWIQISVMPLFTHRTASACQDVPKMWDASAHMLSKASPRRGESAGWTILDTHGRAGDCCATVRPGTLNTTCSQAVQLSSWICLHPVSIVFSVLPEVDFKVK